MLSFISGGKYDWKQARIEDKIFKVLRSTSGWGPNDDVECTGYTLGLDTNGKSFSFCLSYTQNLNGSDLYGFSIYPDMYTEGLRYMSGFWLPNSFFYDSDPTTKGYSNNKAYEILSIVIKYREDTSNLYQGAQFLSVNGGVESVRCIQDDVTVQTAKSSSSAVSSSSVNSKNDAIENSFKDSRDGQVYKTVVIGSQTWMAQNLNYETDNSYCYDNQDSNCTKYGRLYTWAAAMDSAGVFSLNGAGCGYNRATCSPTIPVRGVCPEGWHLPTKTEWDTLFSTVGSMSTAGRELKSASGWLRYATDAFGFSALPAGDYIGGYFGSLGEMAEFWSASEGDIDHAYSMVLWSTEDKAALREWPKDFGMSVRCLKD